ncbi:MAG: dipeptide ABC transporter ATP-binding protein [Lactobacillaceae bacterium]|jgi:microcin C transport system ATP-binding protein|nr:dipeptide ABC transporter ATP-binding protein [Lactobacillaceae bacterium]
MSLLEVKNLSVSFKNGLSEDIKAVDDVSFSLKENEVLGIVGESGSGKSVTSLSILGLLPYPKAYHSQKSSIKFQGKELNLDNEKQLEAVRGKDISFIFQEPMSSLNPLHTIERQIAEIILTHNKISHKDANKEVLRLLKLTGIQNAKERIKSYPHELSGGQRQRIMIAMAIANNPKILIADEPTTALDVTVQAQILDLLLELKKQNKMSMLFISHDLNVIRKVANRVCVMKDGRIIETGTVKEVFNNPKHEYTKKLIASSLSLKKTGKSGGKKILEAKGINISYPIEKSFWGRTLKEIKAVNNVSLSLNTKETLGIVGESGSGKTTLGMAIANLAKYTGTTLFEEKIINKNNKKEIKNIRKKLQIVFQDPYNSLNPRMNIEEIIAEGLEVHFPEISKEEKQNKICRVLSDVGLDRGILSKYPHEFSGGQRQRIAIARALILTPEIIILDEPTSALDVTIQKQIVELLNEIQQKQGISYIFISHDMNVIKAVSDKIIVMKDGKVVETGLSEQIFNHPENEYTKKLIKANL